MAAMAAATIGAAAIGAFGASSANRASAGLSKQMYKHRYQWQVEDLKKAGLNPMLAVSQGAPVPSAPQVQNVGQAAVEGATRGFSAMQAKRLQDAQLRNIEADTSLKGSQSAAAIASAQESQGRNAGQIIGNTIAAEALPYAAGSAARSYETLAATARKVSNEAEQISENIKITEQNYQYLEELQPLLVQYQELQNRVRRAEIPAAEAEAAFWNALPEAAWVKKLREVLPSFPKGVSAAPKVGAAVRRLIK